MKKIIKASAALRRIFTFFNFILLSLTAFWGSRAGSILMLSHCSDPLVAHEITWKGLTGYGLVLVLFILQTYFIWQLKDLFKSYSQGIFFNARNSAYIRRAAVSFLSITFISIIIESLLNIPLTVNYLLGTRWLFGTINLFQLSNVFMGMAVIVQAWIMEEGHRLQEEIDSVV